MGRPYCREDVKLREVGRGQWMTVVGGHVFDIELVNGQWMVVNHGLELFTARNLLSVQAGIVSWLSTVGAAVP